MLKLEKNCILKIIYFFWKIFSISSCMYMSIWDQLCWFYPNLYRHHPDLHFSEILDSLILYKRCKYCWTAVTNNAFRARFLIMKSYKVVVVAAWEKSSYFIWLTLVMGLPLSFLGFYYVRALFHYFLILNLFEPKNFSAFGSGNTDNHPITTSWHVIDIDNCDFAIIVVENVDIS